MDALELLLGRSSAPRLTTPAPTTAELDVMFASAVRAPDHGRLRPWQFVVVPMHKREQFGEVLAASMLRRDPEAHPDMLERERAKALRAPVIVVAAARIRRPHKIPEVEQLASAAAAAQNILLAAHALGYGAIWKTGAPAYDDAVKQALGLADDDAIVGFIYLGTPVADAPALPRAPTQDHVSIWQG